MRDATQDSASPNQRLAHTGESVMAVWTHSRKGRIEGVVIGGDETWVRIRLTRNHKLHYMSEANRGRIDNEGDVIVARRSLLTEIGGEA